MPNVDALVLCPIPPHLVAPGSPSADFTRCPHMAAPLSLGTLDGCVVACVLHRGTFDLSTGETATFPTTGGLDADGVLHASWAPAGTPPKPEHSASKAQARTLTRTRRLRFYPARVRAGILEARVPGLRGDDDD